MEKVFWSHVMNLVKLRRYVKAKGICRCASIAALFAVGASASGCHGVYATIGTPEALREHHRGMNAIITETKATADIKSAYWQALEQREAEHTKRETAPGFMDSLMGGAK